MTEFVRETTECLETLRGVDVRASRRCWDALTGGRDLLFRACRDLVRQPDTEAVGVLAVLDQWEEVLAEGRCGRFIDGHTGDALTAERIRGLFLTTRLAIAFWQSRSDDVLRLLHESAEVLGGVRGDRDLPGLPEVTGTVADAVRRSFQALSTLEGEPRWRIGTARDLTLELLGAPNRPSRSRQMLAPALAPQTETAAESPSLVVELVGHGSGDLYPGRRVLFAGLDEAFNRTCRRAFEDLRHLLPEGHDVRWALTGSLPPRIEGDSLGPTFKVTSRQLFLDEPLDPKAVVLGRMDESGVLHGLDCPVTAARKAEAARRAGARSIVVFSDELPSIVDVVRGVAGDAIVPTASTLEEAAQFAGRPRRALLRYLDNLKDLHSRVNALGVARDLKDLYLRPTGSKGGEPTEPDEGDDDLATDDPASAARAFDAGQAMDWEEVRSFSLEDGTGLFCWVVLGDAGAGKTTWFDHETLRAIEEYRQSLLSGGDGGRLPIAVKPSYPLPTDPRQPLGALLDHVRLIADVNTGDEATVLEMVVRQAWEKGRCALYLDGLDEGDTSRRQNVLVAAKAALERECTVFLTCRTTVWHPAGLPTASTFCLERFSPANVGQFIDRWFERSSVHSSKLKAELAAKPQMAELARTPLMCTLICRAFEQGQLSLPVRRCDLLETCTTGLLSDWPRERHGEADFLLEDKLPVVERLAWEWS